MRRSVALGRYYARKAHAEFVAMTVGGAGLLALPWVGTIRAWQVIAALAAFALGVFASFQLLSAPLVFERLWPVGGRERRTVNWLMSLLVTLAGAAPLVVIYWSSGSHALDASTMQLICLCLILALIARYGILIVGKAPSRLLQTNLLILLVVPIPIAMDVLSKVMGGATIPRSWFGLLLLGSLAVLLVEGLIIWLVGNREVSIAPASGSHQSRGARDLPRAGSLGLPLRDQSLVPQPGHVWQAHLRILALGMLTAPSYLVFVLIISLETFFLGASLVSTLGPIFVMLVWGGREVILGMTRSLSLNGMIDRRLAFVTVLAPLVICIVVSVSATLWIWSPSFTKPRARHVSIPDPDSHESHAYGQLVVLDLSCSSLRPVKLPDGTVMNLEEFAQRLQQHHVTVTSEFLAHQLALVTVRDEGFMPDPRLLLQGFQGDVSTKPILGQIAHVRCVRLLLFAGIVMTALMVSFAVQRTGGPRPYRGYPLRYMYWEYVVPLLLFALVMSGMVPDLIMETQHVPIVLAQDLAYPPVIVSWKDRLQLLMVAHAGICAGLLAVIGAGSSWVALRRIRHLELDPTQSGDLWSRMKNAKR